MTIDHSLMNHALINHGLINQGLINAGHLDQLHSNRSLSDQSHSDQSHSNPDPLIDLDSSGSLTPNEPVSKTLVTQTAVAIKHSEMAMRAARAMRRSKQKKRTGRAVCHHLRMMLAANGQGLAHRMASVEPRGQSPQENQFSLTF